MNVFVSLPYTHTDKDVIKHRYETACKYSAKLLREGHIALSPIVTGHAILTVAELPNTFEFWKNYCFETLKLCEELHVLQLDGWHVSKGIAEELEFAGENGITIRMISEV